MTYLSMLYVYLLKGFNITGGFSQKRERKSNHPYSTLNRQHVQQKCQSNRCNTANFQKRYYTLYDIIIRLVQKGDIVSSSILNKIIYLNVT